MDTNGTTPFNQRSKDLTDTWEKAIRERKARLLLEQDPVEIELPSGASVLAVRAPLITLLEAGRIPDGLTPFVLDLFVRGNQLEKPEEASDRVMKTIEERWQEYVKTLDAVFVATVAAPVFTAQDPPPEGSLRLADVTLADKIAVFNWCQGVTNYLAAFRVGQDGPAPAVAAESGVPEQDGGGAPGNRPLAEPVAVVADQLSDHDVGPVRRRQDRGSKGSSRQPAQA